MLSWCGDCGVELVWRLWYWVGVESGVELVWRLVLSGCGYCGVELVWRLWC